MEIVALNSKSLTAYINSEAFEKMPNIPISRHRAIAQINNPRVDEEDVLLLLAMEGEQLVGYIGMVPDWIFQGEFKSKCAWMSCIWIDGSQRGKGIANRLVRKCFEVWDKKIVFTEFTPAAKRLYDKIGIFTDLHIKQGLRLYIRMDLANILPPRKAIFEKSKKALRFMDQFSNLVLDRRLPFFDQEADGFNYTLVKFLSPSVRQLIDTTSPNNIFKRNIEELEWILEFPWVLSGMDADPLNEQYFFTSADHSFDYYPIEISNHRQEVIAFILLTKRNDTLKIPYCFAAQEQIPMVAQLIKRFILKYKVKTFTSYHAHLNEYLEDNSSYAIFKKAVNRHYLMGKELAENLDLSLVEIQDGDGDAAFT